jgi:hypothetical protein
MKNIYKIIILSVVAIAILVSCSSDNPTTPTPTPDATKVDVKWTDITVQFQPEEVISTDSTFSFFKFDSNNNNAKKLKVGSIIFVYGKALKKVSTIEDKSGQITVKTKYCRLNEAISDGEISWTKNIKWNSSLLSLVGSDSKKNVVQVGEKTEVEFKFPVDDLQGEIKLTLKDNRLDASCNVIKEVNKMTKVTYGFEGYIQDVKSEGKIKFANGTLQEFNHVNKNIEGEVTVQLIATGSLSELLGPIELPFVLLKVPIVVGGFPMMINLKVLFVINTKTITADASAFVKSKFKFNSTTGIKYDGTEFGANANVGPYSYDFVKDSNWVGSSMVAGLNFGITFPRFELEMFGETIVPFVHTAFLIGGSFTAGTKPCMTIDASFIGAVGCNLDFFGVLKGSVTKTLWQFDKNIRKSGTCQ